MWSNRLSDRRRQRRGARPPPRRQAQTETGGADRLGVWPDGHWEILHWKIAAAETAEAWDACFEELYARGHRRHHSVWWSVMGGRARQRARSPALWVPHQRCISTRSKTWPIISSISTCTWTPDSPRPPPTPGQTGRKHAILADAGRIYTTTGKPRSCPGSGLPCHLGSTGAHSGGQLLHRLRPNLALLDVDIPRVFVSLIAPRICSSGSTRRSGVNSVISHVSKRARLRRALVSDRHAGDSQTASGQAGRN